MVHTLLLFRLGRWVWDSFPPDQLLHWLSICQVCPHGGWCLLSSLCHEHHPCVISSLSLLRILDGDSWDTWRKASWLSVIWSFKHGTSQKGPTPKNSYKTDEATRKQQWLDSPCDCHSALHSGAMAHATSFSGTRVNTKCRSKVTVDVMWLWSKAPRRRTIFSWKKCWFLSLTTLKSKGNGAPGYLSQLSVCFQLRSWSQSPGIEPWVGPPAQWGVCFSLYPLPAIRALSLSLK